MRQNLTNFFTEVATSCNESGHLIHGCHRGCHRELPPSITTTDITLSKRANNITF